MISHHPADLDQSKKRGMGTLVGWKNRVVLRRVRKARVRVGESLKAAETVS